MASQTPRRSTRIGSAARSIASRSAVSVVIDTPNNDPRALPKIKARQSTAYGASGRVAVAQQLAVPQTGFAEAFEATRSAAVARTSRESSARSSPAPRRSTRNTPSQADYESEDPLGEDEVSEDEEEISADTSKSFGMNHEAGMLRGPSPMTQTPARLARATPSIAPSSSVAPSSIRPDPERRLPAARPLHAVPIDRPTLASVRESPVSAANPRLSAVAAAAGLTPRAPTAQSLETSGANLRAPASRLGGFTPRAPADRPVPAAAANGSRFPPLRPPPRRWTPPQSTSETETEAEAEVQAANGMFRGPWVDSIKGLPWLNIALATAIAMLAVTLGFLAMRPSSPFLPTPSSHGWKGFTGHFWTPASAADNSALKARVKGVEISLKDIQSYIHNLGDEVPDYVVVSRSPSGTINVPKQFWDAIISKIRTEGPSIEWETFVQHNEEKLRSTIGTEAAVLRKDLFEAIDRNFDSIAADFNKKLEAHTRILLKDAEQVAAREAKKVAIDLARLRSMALSNLIANIELQYGKPNYFSTGLGATIITGITSPTLSLHASRFRRMMHRVVAPKINPPLTALQSWDEPGDCWCAATPKAQLGIQLGEPMYPTQLTIEHLPRSSAPSEDIRSAPQHIELWIRSDEPALVRFAFEGDQCSDGPHGWQCLGKVRYDRNGANHVQTFLLDGEAQTPVDKVMLRVTSNWGADHSCLYRVRLHGKGLRPVEESERSV